MWILVYLLGFGSGISFSVTVVLICAVASNGGTRGDHQD